MPELLESPCNLERVAVIFNPASGGEDMAARRSRLEALAQEAGLTCDLTETDEQEGAAPLAREALADGMERVIVSGGDGSIMEAAGALVGTQTALAVIPGGTGNLLALNLGIPLDQAAAMRLGVTGEPRPIDVGRANGEVFLIIAGMGNDARMIRDADREMKNRLGFLAYFVAAWKHRRRPRVLYTVTVDGRTFRRHAHSVMVANLGRITGGLEIVPGADPADGILDIALLRPRTPRDYARLAFNVLMRQSHKDPHLETYQGRTVVIEARRSQPVQLDGNEAPRTDRLEVSVEPGALQIVLPPGPIKPLSPPEMASATVGRSWVPVAAGIAAFAAVRLLGQRSEPSSFLARQTLASALIAGVAVAGVAAATQRR